MIYSYLQNSIIVINRWYRIDDNNIVYYCNMIKEVPGTCILRTRTLTTN